MYVPAAMNQMDARHGGHTVFVSRDVKYDVLSVSERLTPKVMLHGMWWIGPKARFLKLLLCLKSDTRLSKNRNKFIKHYVFIL